LFVIFGLAGVALILIVLVDAFESIVLPRRVTHRFRLAKFYYLTAWQIWHGLATRMPGSKMRQAFLGCFGPLSLLGLLTMWVVGLIFGFALLHWSIGTAVTMPDKEVAQKGVPDFVTYLYWSGGTFFTLGYGDVTPNALFGRALAVMEAGMGFGFLALIIGYLPVIHSTFSHREMLIALLDARAGSPPSAAQLLTRAGQSGNLASLDPFLAQWEQWSAELLESHLSFPVLTYYRSQHDNQSWVSALTAVLDTCAVMMAMIRDHNPFQAQLTFAMSRHAAVDLGLIFKAKPTPPVSDRLPVEQLERLRSMLSASGFNLHDPAVASAKLTELRGMYEPFVVALSERFLFALPAIVPERPVADNWQRSAWQRAPEIGSLPADASLDGHFG
jgi:hypothetical protein